MAVGGDDVEVPGVALDRVIGRGASSVVYLGTQTRFDRPVAVKVLHLPGQTELVGKLFLNECRTLGRLSPHPNVVSVFDGGFIDDERPFLVMEYLPGGTLADELVAGGPIPFAEVLRVGVQLAGGVHSVHLHGIIHGDIKPANVLRTRTGDVALADFGIARLMSSTATTRAPLLTPLHAAPELFEGGAITPRTDVYELCSTLFELLDGQASLGEPTDSPLLVLGRMARGDRRRLDRDRVPDVVATVIEAGLSTDPDQRPATALELGEQLRSAQRTLGLDPTPLVVIEPLDSDESVQDPRPAIDHGPSARSSAAGTAPSRTAGVEAGRAGDTLPPPDRRRSLRPLALAVAVVVAAVLVGVVVFALVRGGDDGTEVTTSGGPSTTWPDEVRGTPSAGFQPGIEFNVAGASDRNAEVNARLGDGSQVLGTFGSGVVVSDQPPPFAAQLPVRFRWQAFNPQLDEDCLAIVSWPLTVTGWWEKRATWSGHQAVVRVLKFASERDAVEAFNVFSLEQGVTGDDCHGFRSDGKPFDHDRIEVAHRAVDLGLGDDVRWNSFVGPPPREAPGFAAATSAIVQKGEVLVFGNVLTSAEPVDPAVLGSAFAEILSRLSA